MDDDWPEVARLGSLDLTYTEELMKQLYVAEIDRKDKILSSISVLSSPIALLVAAVVFLVNQSPKFIPLAPNALALPYFLFLMAMFVFIVRLLYFFHRLLSGENYYYLPDAHNILRNICEIEQYCTDKNLAEDGRVTAYARANFIARYAESATKNCTANDRRLKYRQKIFSSTMFAVVSAALAFAVLAMHQLPPDVQNIPSIWRPANAATAHTAAPAGPSGTAAATPSLANTNRAPATPGAAPAGH